MANSAPKYVQIRPFSACFLLLKRTKTHTTSHSQRTVRRLPHSATAASTVAQLTRQLADLRANYLANSASSASTAPSLTPLAPPLSPCYPHLSGSIPCRHITAAEHDLRRQPNGGRALARASSARAAICASCLPALDLASSAATSSGSAEDPRSRFFCPQAGQSNSDDPACRDRRQPTIRIKGRDMRPHNRSIARIDAEEKAQ